MQAFITLKAPLKPKERPRFSLGGHAYMTSAYRKWKEVVRAQAVEQWGAKGQWSPVALHISLYGPRRGDLDNLGGAVMDALTGVVYPDDSVTHIRHLSVMWAKAPTIDQTITVLVSTHEVP